MTGSSEWLTESFILFGGFLALLLSVGEFPHNRKDSFQVFFFGTLVSIGLMQLSGYSALHPRSEGESIFGFLNLPFVFLPPAFGYLTVASLSEDDFHFRPRHFFLFFPFLISVAVSIYSATKGVSNSANLGPLGISYIFASLYAIVLAISVWSRFLRISEPKAKFLFTIFLLDNLVVSLLGILGILFDPFFLRLALLIVSLVVCLIYYVRRKFFEFPEIVKTDLLNAKYANSRLVGMDLEPILQRMKSLFENDKIHRREDITLALLAEELSLTGHQLSELINQRIGKTYYGMINQYRVEDAKVLLAETDKTVLEIAMTVGFNNRSSFNEAFLRQTQKTPISFRKMCKPL